jgi:hypothetical protein
MKKETFKYYNINNNTMNTQKEQLNKCHRCNYHWMSRKDNPVQCPRCKRYDWVKDNTPLKETSRQPDPKAIKPKGGQPALSASRVHKNKNGARAVETNSTCPHNQKVVGGNKNEK